MLQFVGLLTAMDKSGAEAFAEFLNNASSSDASRAGRWLSGASQEKVRQAASLLNAGDVDGFRELIGCGSFWGWLFGRKKKAVPKKPARPQPEPDVQQGTGEVGTANIGARSAINRIESGAHG